MKERFYRDKGNRVIAQIYLVDQRRQIKIPRKYIKHLDRLTNTEEIQTFIDNWANLEYPALKIKARFFAEKDEAKVLFDKFVISTDTLRENGLSEETKRDFYYQYFEKYIGKFFGARGIKDVRAWGFHLIDLRDWLLHHESKSRKLTSRVLSRLEQFSKYLVEARIIAEPWLVNKPDTGANDHTPLPREIKPEDIMGFAQKALKAEEPREDIALLALIGFYMGLRPGETFALKREDFFTGEQSEKRSITNLRFAKYGLGSKLTVVINKQKKRDKITREGDKITAREVNTPPPKTPGSKGYVTCWDKDAAKAIAVILQGRQTGPLFVQTRDVLFDKWAEVTKSGELADITLHDLRRASGFYLGRILDIPFALLQDHLRHKDPRTTHKYTRRPKDDYNVTADQQDFDDVS